MAERRGHPTHESDEKLPTTHEAHEKPYSAHETHEKAHLFLEYTATVGDEVGINGTLFSMPAVNPLWDWSMRRPDGHTGQLTNGDTQGPGFIVELEGDYTLTLSTLEGMATVVVHVTAPK